MLPVSSSIECKRSNSRMSSGVKVLGQPCRHSFYLPAGPATRMHCSCVNSTASYERLPSPGSSLEIRTVLEMVDRGDFEAEKEDASNEKEVELTFYNDDGSFKMVVVERNLCANDLCQLLALKNHVAKDANWTIVEYWVDLGIERNLEDHEDVLAVHHLSEQLGRHSEKRFIFRKDFRKYEFFRNPQQFFPTDMMDLNGYQDMSTTAESSSLGRTIALQTLLATTDDCPPVFGYLWVRENNKQVWRKAFFLLKDRALYYSYKSPVDGEQHQLKRFGQLCDYNVFATLNAKNQFRAPTEFGLCLRPARAESGDDTRDLQCLACDSERARLCWITAMRLAKYGKQLRESYKSFKAKQMESLSNSPKDYNSYQVPNESVRSRVAMDFTGTVGRIVEDPKEAKAIAVAEGYQWKRRWRPHLRAASLVGMAQGLEAGVHTVQPWFHSGMSRDQATRLLTRHGTVDGVFLVRESRSTPGAFVLSFVSGGKVLHTQIVPVVDQMRETVCYSLDVGKTKFYDLLQLVEFYQLNSGCLPTRLTYYIVQTATGPFNAHGHDDRVVPASF